LGNIEVHRSRIKFVGHPNLKRLLLPEDVPEDYHPLRRA
ncbi:NADH-quinone oxidoreductase subunit C, partial [archaeon]|nr:NADH-quinone oxidoreductase subunit C [archaeon]